MPKTMTEAEAVAKLAGNIDADERAERARNRAEQRVRDQRDDLAPTGRASDQEALTLDDAVDAVSRQLETEDAKIEGATVKAELEEPDPDEIEAQADDSAEDVEDNDDTDAEDDVDDDSDDVDPDDWKATRTVKVDGQEIEVTPEQALKGFMLQQAFTRKTQALAETRKEVETEKAAYANEVTRFKSALDVIEGAFIDSMSPEQRLQVLQLQQAAETQLQTHQQESQAAAVREALDTFHTAAGNFDSEAQTRAENELVGYMQGVGLSDEDVRIVASSPIGLETFRKAMLYDNATGGKNPGRAKNKAGVSLKPGSKPPSSQGQRERRGQKQLRKKFQQSGGSIESAIELVASMIDID